MDGWREGVRADVHAWSHDQDMEAQVTNPNEEPYWSDAQDIAEERCGNDCDCRRSDPPDTWCYKHDDWREEAEHE
jgi:hypothetical protein